MVKSVLDHLGEEVCGIITPVSICMAVTVALVRLLNPNGDSSATVYIATAYYHEQDGDSASKRFTGSLINALIFVAMVTAMTCVLVLLFKHGYTRVIYGYMAFAGFSVFFMLTGILSVLLLQKAGGHFDAISFLFILWNFAVVGVLAVFYWPAPLTLKQGYLVVTSVITAYVFTWVPEWTTWMLLVFMAVYDLVAVLSPVGPLKMLVELADERGEDIPALIYEGRPTSNNIIRSRARREAALRAREEQLSATDDRDDAGAGPSHSGVELNLDVRASHGDAGAEETGASVVVVAQLSGHHFGAGRPPTQVPVVAATALVAEAAAADARSNSGDDDDDAADGDDAAPLLARGRGGGERAAAGGDVEHGGGGRAGAGDVERGGGGGGGGAWGLFEVEDDDEDDDELGGLPDAIKLGLGDFIFYSFLMGRAAMYDLLTAFAAYLAIVAGLGLTLLLLAVHQKALPALPISITLGCLMYATARWVISPVVVGLTTNLVFF